MTNTHKTVNDFEEGQEVLYIPHHAANDSQHKDCERGVVTGKNSVYIFVKFNPNNPHGQPCNPSNLV